MAAFTKSCSVGFSLKGSAAASRRPATAVRPVATPASLSKAMSNMKLSASSSQSLTGTQLECSVQRSSSSAAVATTCGYDAGVGIFGNKAGMTQTFTEDGLCVPVTVIAIYPGNYVTQVLTEDKDGYNGVQVGYDKVRDYKITKPEQGHLAKAGVPNMRHLEEFRLKDSPTHEPGDKLNAMEMFKAGDLVDVQGKSIGKGFQGAVKRYGFHRGLMTHGSKSHRQLGSIGPGTTPGRVYPGKKMPGHMGNEKTTIRKLKVVRVEDDCLIVKGAVPGKPGNLLRIAPAKIVGKNI